MVPGLSPACPTPLRSCSWRAWAGCAKVPRAVAVLSFVPICHHPAGVLGQGRRRPQSSWLSLVVTCRYQLSQVHSVHRRPQPLPFPMPPSCPEKEGDGDSLGPAASPTSAGLTQCSALEQLHIPPRALALPTPHTQQIESE